MTEEIQVRNLSSRTRRTYSNQVSLNRPSMRVLGRPLGPEQIRQFQMVPASENELIPDPIAMAVAPGGSSTAYRSRETGISRRSSQLPSSSGSCRPCPAERRTCNCWPASGGGQPAPGEYRPPAHGAARRPRQGWQGPLRHALEAAVPLTEKRSLIRSHITSRTTSDAAGRDWRTCWPWSSTVCSTASLTCATKSSPAWVGGAPSSSTCGESSVSSSSRNGPHCWRRSSLTARPTGS